ncbi:stage II sporulation protein R [Acetanaerobacterium elongatum]|uniref:Stage II sporulation protein R n=1 Tax=Acetanaerobacterium elongatum TaxID=258515 RepID=A0A1H0DIT6_9FIRM|nr:stage II sporulation protein R [Acetanaerobacterium elongatum]SDN70197.1 stage II sporulation protein R [Acetanaerobacterium elongatum]
MKKLELSIFIALLLTIAVGSFTGFAQRCEELSGKVLRLHVIANSDSTADQSIKLKVRDTILKESGTLLFNNPDKQNAKKRLSQNLEEIEVTANRMLAENGFDYQAQASIENKYFNTRVYDNVTLPAGYYDSLCIRLGKAQGKNWWCVVYPPMCLPAACEEAELAEVLNDDELHIVTDKGSYVVKFKLLELYEKLVGRKK